MTADLAARLGNEAGSAGQLVDSTPYPWPWDGRFAPQRCALLVLVTDDPVLPEIDPAWDVIRLLAETLSHAGGLVVEVRTARPARLAGGSARPSLAARPAAEPQPARFGADLVLAAPGWDAFFETPLDTWLRNGRRDLLLIVGGWLEVGVHGTMRSANDRGYECLLVLQGCIAIDDVTRAATVSSTEMSGGIFGAVAGPSGTSALFPRPNLSSAFPAGSD